MIKSNELRRGNLLHDAELVPPKQKLLKVTVIAEKGIRAKRPQADETGDVAVPYGALKGIKLTGEILDGIPNKSIIYLSKYSIICTRYLKGISFNDLKDEDIKILFVHNLQNIFFALKGEELKIKM